MIDITYFGKFSKLDEKKKKKKTLLRIEAQQLLVMVSTSVDSFKVALSNIQVKMEAVCLRSSVRSLSCTIKKKVLAGDFAQRSSKKYLVRIITQPTVFLDKKTIKIWVRKSENSNIAAFENFKIMSREKRYIPNACLQSKRIIHSYLHC